MGTLFLIALIFLGGIIDGGSKRSSYKKSLSYKGRKRKAHYF